MRVEDASYKESTTGQFLLIIVNVFAAYQLPTIDN